MVEGVEIPPEGILPTLLPEAQGEAGVLPPDGAVAPQEQQPRPGGVQGMVLAPAGAAAAQQQLRVREGGPVLIGDGLQKVFPVALDALGVQGAEAQLPQGAGIPAAAAGIPLHGPDLLRRAAVVPVSPAAVGPPEGVAVQEDRPVLALGPGDREDHDAAALHGLHRHVLRAQEVGADPLPVPEPGPDGPDVLLRPGQVHRAEALVPPLLHPQEDDAPQGVGEGGIAFPQALRQAPQGQLRLDAVVLPVVPDAAKFDHRRPSPVVFPIIPRTQQKGKRLRGWGGALSPPVSPGSLGMSIESVRADTKVRPYARWGGIPNQRKLA